VQTLAFEIATTFVDDAAVLVGGCGRIIVQILVSPIERIANACDVAGVLANRRFSHAMRARQRQPGLKGTSELRRPRRRRSYWLLGSLGDLT
jgi:hypothetical protein